MVTVVSRCGLESSSGGGTRSIARVGLAVRYPTQNMVLVTLHLVVLWLLALSPPVAAQTGLTGGAIQGTVTDEAGQALSGVPVTLIGRSPASRGPS